MSRVSLAAALAVVSAATLSSTAGAQVVPVMPVVTTPLEPTPYGPELLPASATRPYIIVPRYGFSEYAAPGLRWGFRTSPYGDYSRFNYTSTGPFPALPRPYVWFPCDHPKKGLAHDD
jgi:hypothetical protein